MSLGDLHHLGHFLDACAFLHLVEFVSGVPPKAAGGPEYFLRPSQNPGEFTTDVLGRLWLRAINSAYRKKTQGAWSGGRVYVL